MVLLRQIFWAYGEEMTRYWRTLHSEELRDLYFSRLSVRMIKWWGRRVGHVARFEAEET
jgi:hypothetical protein